MSICNELHNDNVIIFRQSSNMTWLLKIKTWVGNIARLFVTLKIFILLVRLRKLIYNPE